MKRILVVDGDAEVRAQIAKYAKLEGYEVTEVGDGETAVSLCRQRTFDMMVLAVMLPKIDGFTVLQTVRGFSRIPILVLSARGGEHDRIQGLELGADDYMSKPFAPRELLLRISIILKRYHPLEEQAPKMLVSGGISLDQTARRLEVDGRRVSLTPKEFDLLALLMGHPDVAFSRKELLHMMWGGELPEDTRTLDTHIKQVRNAIAPYSDRIVTLRGVGYRFEKM